MDTKNFFCGLLKVNSVTILLDCPIDLCKLVEFSPTTLSSGKDSKNKVSNFEISSEPIKFEIPSFETIDLNKVDAILISNFYNMLALPFVTEVG